MSEKERSIQLMLARLSVIIDHQQIDKGVELMNLDLSIKEADLLYQSLSLMFLFEKNVIGGS